MNVRREIFELVAHRDDLVRPFLRQLLADLRIRLGSRQLFAQLCDGCATAIELGSARGEIVRGGQQRIALLAERTKQGLCCVTLCEVRITLTRDIAQLHFHLQPASLFVAAGLRRDLNFAMRVPRARFGCLQRIAQCFDLCGELGLSPTPFREGTFALQQRSAIGADGLLARCELRLQLRAGRELVLQPLIQIVANRDELIDGARVLPDGREQPVVLGQLGREPARQLSRAGPLVTQRPLGSREHLGMIVLQLLQLRLVALQLFAQLLLRTLRHLVGESAMLGETRALGCECFATRGVPIAFDLQRFVVLVQDRVRIVRPHDVRFEVGDALQDAIDVDRERFRRRPGLVDVDAANFDRRFVRRRIDQLVDVAQRFDRPGVGARQGLLTLDQGRFVGFDIEHRQYVGAIQRVDREVGGSMQCLRGVGGSRQCSRLHDRSTRAAAAARSGCC